MRLNHRAVIRLSSIFILMLGLMASAPALAGDRGEPTKASFDAVSSSESPILQFRSVAFGVAPIHMFELDFYLASKWGVGANLYGSTDFCHQTDGACRQTTGLGAHVERFFGGRWGHIGLRTGLFATTYYVQNRSIYDGSPVARNGGLFGPQFGLTATFTPTRWTGLTVALIGMPGFFEGFKTREYVEHTFEVDDDTGQPTREFLFTGILTVGLRFGVLDGPTAICECCRDASIPCGQ